MGSRRTARLKGTLTEHILKCERLHCFNMLWLMREMDNVVVVVINSCIAGYNRKVVSEA